MSSAAKSAASPPVSGLRGHPAGLWALFFTELWERFSYYGMRALLVLFMVAPAGQGGLGFDDATATAIYGLYTAAVYVMALPGGWVADRLLGAQQAIWYGGITIMFGHFTLALPGLTPFFLGLLLIVLGTGLLKPNISAVVGDLYAPGDPRRDSGFTLFYMGINVGAFLGPLVCSALGESERFGWHYGFAAAGVGMLAGLVVFRLSRWRLGEVGRLPSLRREIPAERAQMVRGWRHVLVGLAVLLVSTALLLAGVIRLDAVRIASGATLAVVLAGGAYLAWLLSRGDLDRGERDRVKAIFILSMAASMFWAGFEQAGSTLNLFAERHTERLLSGLEIPAGWFQMLNPLFIVTLGPIMASLWVRLALRGREPATPVKFGLALLVLGAGFAVMIPAAGLVADGGRVLPSWLLTTYLLHTVAELALSPVGLSATTKLAPHRYTGQMMGIWFLTSALGNLIAGLAAGRFDENAVHEFPALYAQIVLMTAGTGLLLLLASGRVRRLMGTVH